MLAFCKFQRFLGIMPKVSELIVKIILKFHVGVFIIHLFHTFTLLGCLGFLHIRIPWADVMWVTASLVDAWFHLYLLSPEMSVLM